MGKSTPPLHPCITTVALEQQPSSKWDQEEGGMQGQPITLPRRNTLQAVIKYNCERGNEVFSLKNVHRIFSFILQNAEENNILVF